MVGTSSRADLRPAENECLTTLLQADLMETLYRAAKHDKLTLEHLTVLPQQVQFDLACKIAHIVLLWVLATSWLTYTLTTNNPAVSAGFQACCAEEPQGRSSSRSNVACECCMTYGASYPVHMH